MMVAYIDEHVDRYGVEPICEQLPITPSTYYAHKACESDVSLCCARARRDVQLEIEIIRAWNENFRAYGAYKIWKQLNREGIRVARCTVERLMRKLGIRGVIRGKGYKTTVADPGSERPADLVERSFAATAPNRLWVADITFVATWRGPVYVAFVIDVFSRMIVGWRVWNSLKTDLVLDALEQALHARDISDSLIHHSDRGSQGGFKRTSQHLGMEVMRWLQEDDEDRRAPVDHRYTRPADRQWRSVSIDSGSGRRLQKGLRVKMLAGLPAYRRRLVAGGSGKEGDAERQAHSALRTLPVVFRA